MPDDGRYRPLLQETEEILGRIPRRYNVLSELQQTPGLAFLFERP